MSIYNIILGIFLFIGIGILLWRHLKYTPEGFQDTRLPPGVKRLLTIYKVSWCPHCQRLTQPVDMLEGLLRDQPLPGSRLEVVDCEEDPRACREAGVRSYPTLHLEEEGTTTPLVVPKTVNREDPKALYLLLRNGL